MSGRISSNRTRYDVKAGTIKKNEYKWRYLKSPKLNKDMHGKQLYHLIYTIIYFNWFLIPARTKRIPEQREYHDIIR
jgi:hypothetical protein